VNRRKLARRAVLAVKIAERHRYALMFNGDVLATTFDREEAKRQRRSLATDSRYRSGSVYILDRSFTPARMVR